jgi:hypothetical protein
MNRQHIRCESLTANNLNAGSINGQSVSAVGRGGSLVLDSGGTTFDVSTAQTVILKGLAGPIAVTLDVSKPPPSGSTVTFVGYDNGVDDWGGGNVAFSDSSVVFDNKGSAVSALIIGANGCATVVYTDVDGGYWFVSYTGNNVTVDNP